MSGACRNAATATCVFCSFRPRGFGWCRMASAQILRSSAATGISAGHVDANDWHCGSEPAVAAKSPVERAADGDDQADHKKIAIAPFELRHELEVHAVDAGDCGRHGEDGSPGREPSGD